MRPRTTHRDLLPALVGVDALNALQSVTFDLDQRNGAGYRDRFKDFLAGM
jgi:hypothetical protein